MNYLRKKCREVITSRHRVLHFYWRHIGRDSGECFFGKVLLLDKHNISPYFALYHAEDIERLDKGLRRLQKLL